MLDRAGDEVPESRSVSDIGSVGTMKKSQELVDIVLKRERKYYQLFVKSPVNQTIITRPSRFQNFKLHRVGSFRCGLKASRL